MLLNVWELVNTWDIPSVAAVEAESPSGGYGIWDDFEKELARRRKERKRRLRLKKKAARITVQLDRELYLAERKQEAETARKAELARTNKLVANYQDTIMDLGSPRVIKAMQEALEFQTFSKMERLDRELKQLYEEEQFMILATQILINQQV